MRKIETQMNSAIRSRRNWQSGNTRVEITADNRALVYLHSNLFANVDNNDIQIFDGGWQSVTTKSRLNALLDEFFDGARVVQKDFQWFLIDSIDGSRRPFFSGMTV